MSSPAITTGSNANLSATNIPHAGRNAAACNDALGCASRFINACTRRHGAFRRGAAVPRAQVELVSVRRTRLPLVPGRARWKVMHLATNQGKSTRNADRADRGKERKRETKTTGAGMKPGRYFHSQRITTRVCRFWVANTIRTHPPNVRYGRNAVLSGATSRKNRRMDMKIKKD